METTTNSGGGKADFSEAIAASAAAEIEKKQDGRPPRTYHEKLPCSLTSEELAEKGSQIAAAYAEIEVLEGELKNVKDGFKAKIALVEQRIRDLANVLSSKKENREVELVEEFIFATNTVRVTRSDTGEKVSERAMTKNERQEELPLDPKRTKKSAGAEKKDAASPKAEASPTETTTSAPEGATAAKKKRGRKDKAS